MNEPLPTIRPDPAAVERFERDGFLVQRDLLPPERVLELRTLAEADLDPLIGPAEYEADVHYPGAPASRTAPGGETPRRLLFAIARDEAFRRAGTDAGIAAWLGALFHGAPVCLAQGHHNCVMTKHPGYSSATLWHQDIRYWSFDRPELVSVWLALGDERAANGALKVIPGSHRLELDRGRFDAELFLRPELEENAALIDTAVDVELEAGDVLFFDARTFHAAGRNETDAVKLSLVFTYHREDNRPIPGTRSANYPSLPLASR
jgi:phytanoyl-CoA hydroxylase